MGEIWNVIILQPLINILIVIYRGLFYNFGLSIIALTLIIRAATLPLTLKQVKATKAVQELQPKLFKLQKKYTGDRQKLAEETMKVYKESGVSPAGCILPTIIQMPVWIALYQAIVRVLAATPEDFLGLSRLLYSWPLVHAVLPLQNQFLWLDLSALDPFYILPILVAGTMWVQQKMVTLPTLDPAQDQRNRMMLWMMPLMFAFFTLSFPSGLSLYWVISNIATVALQYLVMGWGGLAKQKVVVTR